MSCALYRKKDGRTDAEALAQALTADVCCFYVQQPNFYGNLEDCTALGETVHQAGAKYIMGCNPIALAVMKTPAACGADIAVGEGQPLGLPLAYGGPYLGFMAATSAMVRKLPGRIVGETKDADGNRAYVLTLQAREQHIRREKASSNVCSNQALCALTAAVYMSTMGPEGIKQAAVQSMSKAHYFAQKLAEIPGVTVQNQGAWFHEFVTSLPVPADKVLDALAAENILGGLPVQEGILWCVTEVVSKEQLDRTAAIIGGGVRSMQLIFEKSKAGRGCAILPACDVPEVQLPEELQREQALYLPELSETEISRHYTALAKRAHGVNDGFYPLGSCTMKYNPRIDEENGGAAGLYRYSSVAAGRNGNRLPAGIGHSSPIFMRSNRYGRCNLPASGGRAWRIYRPAAD